MFYYSLDNIFEGMEGGNDASQSSMPSAGMPNNTMSDQSSAPYPVGGLFNIPNYQPEGVNVPMPGTHAPPSTPNATSQLSPSTSTTNVNISTVRTGE